MRSSAIHTDLIPVIEAIVGPAHIQRLNPNEPSGFDATFLDGAAFAAVYPRHCDEVAAVLKTCNDNNTPLIARGAGTSLVGGPVPLACGIVLQLDRLTALAIDPGNVCAVVGAGVITGDLKEAAAHQGLMYPPDPGSVEISTMGGNVACNAGGMNSIKYGVTADYVIGLTVALTNGRVLRLGGRTRKRSSGYRLMQLFVGSEGTLGVVTEVIVKLIPLPRFRYAAMVGFDRLEDAAEAVARILASGHFPCAVEILDANAISLLSEHLPERFRPSLDGILIVEQDGNDEETTKTELKHTVELLGGAIELVAETEAQREALWAGRRYFGRVLLNRRKNTFAEDIAVPISAIPEMVRRIQALALETGLTIATVGHAGDGNLHPNIVFEDDQRSFVGPAAARIMRYAVELGGTISAEHGLGALKRDFAELEHGADAMALMRELKSLLDPGGILNPHKVFPESPADDSFITQLPGWLQSEA